MLVLGSLGMDPHPAVVHRAHAACAQPLGFGRRSASHPVERTGLKSTSGGRLRTQGTDLLTRYRVPKAAFHVKLSFGA